MSDDDREFLQNLEDDEKYIHDRIPHQKGKKAMHILELLAIGLRHPKVAEILGKEWEEIEDSEILSVMFPDISEEERLKKAVRFNELYNTYLDAENEQWIYSEEGEEFERYLLQFKHLLEDDALGHPRNKSKK